MTQLSNSDRKPNLVKENEILFYDTINNDTRENALDFSCDVFIENEDEIIAIELKSVKPNSGEMGDEKRKILEGKAALYENFPSKKINFYIGFPFDPLSGEALGKDKNRFTGSVINLRKYFHNDEILLADELWDLLSGRNNTMEELINIINSIATTDFLERYKYINDKSNRYSDKYMDYLKDWNMFSEIELLENDHIIKEKLEENKRLTRTYNSLIFRGEDYNWNRYYKLRELI